MSDTASNPVPMADRLRPKPVRALIRLMAGLIAGAVLAPALLPVGPSHAQESDQPSAVDRVERAVPVAEGDATPADQPQAPPQGVPPSERPGPQPQPVREAPFGPKSTADVVRVDADGSGFFDADENKATFTDNVRVVHPSFNLTADQLEVYLEDSKTGPEGDNQPDALASSIVATESSADSDDMGIRLAIARGRRVIIHRLSDEGELMVGTCRHATFDGRTREMTLRDWPQVQKGVNLIRAVEQSAVIVLTEDGQVRTQGRVRTELTRGADEEAGRVIAPPAGPES